MTGGWTHNTTTSCSVCGHIHAKHSEGRIIPETRSCSDCGYCLRAAAPTPAPRRPDRCWPFDCRTYHETWAHREGEDPCRCSCHPTPITEARPQAGEGMTSNAR